MSNVINCEARFVWKQYENEEVREQQMRHAAESISYWINSEMKEGIADDVLAEILLVLGTNLLTDHCRPIDTDEMVIDVIERLQSFLPH